MLLFIVHKYGCWHFGKSSYACPVEEEVSVKIDVFKMKTSVFLAALVLLLAVAELGIL